jgi:hypothetical protein
MKNNEIQNPGVSETSNQLIFQSVHSIESLVEIPLLRNKKRKKTLPVFIYEGWRLSPNELADPTEHRGFGGKWI